MAKIRKAQAREKKMKWLKYGMRVSNRSIFTIVATIGNKSKKESK
jgi:hypothetical protein